MPSETLKVTWTVPYSKTYGTGPLKLHLVYKHAIRNPKGYLDSSTGREFYRKRFYRKKNSTARDSTGREFHRKSFYRKRILPEEILPEEKSHRKSFFRYGGLPVKSLPVKSHPVESLPVKSLPAKSLPVESLPAEPVSRKRPPTHDACLQALVGGERYGPFAEIPDRLIVGRNVVSALFRSC